MGTTSQDLASSHCSWELVCVCMWRECKLSRAIDVVGAGVRLLAGRETRKGELELYEEGSRAIATPQGARKPLQDDDLGLTPIVEVMDATTVALSRSPTDCKFYLLLDMSVSFDENAEFQ